MSSYVKFRHKLRQEGVVSALQATLRWLTRRVGIPYGVEPYEYVQMHVEQHLHRYLGCGRNEVRRIITVGAHLGYEVSAMLRRYPNVQFRLFEASPRYGHTLQSRFRGQPRVSLHACAVADANGTLTFHETNLAGSGSLLKVGAMARTSYGMTQRESFEVPARRLDDHALEFGYSHESIDCLWIDVQGAELAVLSGARALLPKVRSVFVEVSAFEPLYEGGATLDQIVALLGSAGLVMIGLGLDPANGTGNAMFIRRPIIIAPTTAS